MSWRVTLAVEFDPEFQQLPMAVQLELLAHAAMLKQLGPNAGRPHVDTLKGSRYPNMKELQFRSQRGVWRVAFAFDPERAAILLIAGNKAGVSERRFYTTLIARADERYRLHLERNS